MNQPAIKPNLRDVIGYSFTSPDILRRAMQRKAYCLENGLPDDSHMDGLATLGDAVIELQILTRLVKEGGYDKGEISVKKMDLVNMSILRHAAEKINLPEYVSWGNGEKRNHIWTSGRVLAECTEALIGAVYLDGGLSSSERVMENLGLFPNDDGAKDTENT